MNSKNFLVYIIITIVLISSTIFIIIKNYDNRNTKINPNYIVEKLNNCKLNNSLSYYAEEQNYVSIGMIDIDKQNELLNNCFSHDEIKYIKKNNLIKFEKTTETFEAKILMIKEKEILVKVLNDSKSFTKGDKVRVKVNNEKGILSIDNNVRIVFNGNIETSNPPQIEAYKIEIVN